MEAIIAPNPPKVKVTGDNSADIEIRPLFPGYGMTVGNALRRVLLSSLEGYAITAVKIKDVEHEFSAIEGVLEDVVEIILNLKKVRFKVHNADEPVKLMLKKDGEGKITAAEFEKNSAVEVMNPDAYIATVTDKKKAFEMEIEVATGKGYVATEQREDVEREIGNIQIDAMFSPVKRVSYDVSDIRVGKQTDYNMVVFHIETDGSMSPEEAFSQAANILVQQFKAITSVEEEEEPMTEEVATGDSEPAVETEAAAPQDVNLKLPVDQLGLSTRTSNALLEAEIKTLGQLAKTTDEERENVDGLGQKGITEIKETLVTLGLA